MNTTEYAVYDLQKRVKELERKFEIWRVQDITNQKNEYQKVIDKYKHKYKIIEFRLEHPQKYKKIITEYRELLTGKTESEHELILFDLIQKNHNP